MFLTKTRGWAARLIVVSIAGVLFASACAGSCFPGEDGGGGPLSYYCFSTPLPASGFCETQVFGAGKFVAEPVNALFCLIAVALGISALLRPGRTSFLMQSLYSLLIGWGGFAALYHVGLTNGMYRMMDVAISFLQAYVLWMLICSVQICKRRAVSRTEAMRGPGRLSALFAVLFTLYPAVVHVAGESEANPWVAWLVFDLLWFAIIGVLIRLYMLRKVRSDLTDPRGFRLVWTAVLYCALAYGAWSVDKFVCSAETPLLAYLLLHGWWHCFMAFSFLSLIGLVRYVTACAYGCTPRLTPLLGPVPTGVYFVDWLSESSPSDMRS